MKKFFSVFLVVILIFSCFSCTMAEEATDLATARPVIDLTQIIVSVIGLIFSFLLAWLLKAVVPPLKKWLNAKTTAEQRSLLYQVVQNLVNAAEQMIGRGKGSEKMDYVISALESKGFTVDLDMIESAVKEMNDNAMAQAIAVLTAHATDKESDECDPATDEEGTDTEV